MKANVSLHIDQLLLRGFRAEDRHRIAAAVEAELTRLLTERGLGSAPAGGLDTQRIDGGAFTVAHDAPAEAIGMHVAHGIYGGLKP